MVVEKYRNIGTLAIRVMEECAEAIQRVSKGIRFGWDNHHPNKPGKTNFQLLEEEIRDIMLAFNDLKREEGRENKKVENKSLNF
ncbi:hypothetical protein LCGC14_1640980 [marine sediment metagenome]|uniref:Uncharacterized protein n=1 Tax=marine sediment metagenome TaxID=412755 RepID=A0A0F9KZ83_9ZZZZ